ncbi:MAG: VanW family protein [Intrasporangiaceae bacterium]|nr:VanW family protein [Intrasporangiaceae bacterium]
MQRTDLETEPAWDDTDAEAASPRRRWLLGLVAGLLVLAGAYVGLAYYLSLTVPANAVVGGVDVGGETPEEATRLIESEAALLESEPVVVSVADTSFELDPDRAGLRIDTDATLEGIARFTLNPRDLYEHLSGSFERDFVLAIDEEALSAAVAAAAESIEREPVEGTVEFADGAAQVVQPVEGLAVDVPGTTEIVVGAWPMRSDVEGAGGPVEPETPVSAFTTFTSEFADKALGGPLTVRVGEGAFQVPAEQVATVLGATVGGGTITPTVDEEALTAVVEAAGEDAEVLRDPRDARVTFSGTQASVEPSRTGIAVNVTDQSEALIAALTGEDRTLALEPVVTQPKLTTEKAQETLPKERISTFTTYYTAGQSRNTNIKIAANRLNGTYIPPGEQFSLNQVLGQRTPDKGYVKAGIILNGRLADSYGGGISQLSTTLYNAAYFAGVEFNEFRAHSFYIPRYPEGREATVSWGTIDQRWTNNTRGGVLVRAFATDTAITVEFWGTKTFEVDSVKGPRRNIVQPQEIVDDAPECVTQSPMVGFDVTVTRIIRQDGREVKRENVSTHYDPEDKVTCTHPDSR